LLVLIDALLWLVALTFPADNTLYLRQDLPGLKPEIKYTDIGYGMRSLSLSNLNKPSGSIRALCLGASTTQQSTQNVEDTWCAMAEHQLKSEHPHLNGVFHTLSYGAGGDRAIDTLLWLNENFDAIQPDVVITLLGINDLTWNGGPGYTLPDVDAALAKAVAKSPERTLAAKPRKGTMNRLKELCMSVSQLCRRVKLAWDNLRKSRNLEDGEQIEWHSKNMPRLRAKRRALPAVNEVVRDPDPIEEFEAATQRLLKFLRDRGVQVIVLGQPTIWKPNLSRGESEALWFRVNTANGHVRPSGSWLLEEMRRYNDVQRKLADQHEMTFVDLDSKIPKDLEHYFDDCHYTDRGSQAVAGLVLPSLERVITQLSALEQ
jgi:hypothetical protein